MSDSGLDAIGSLKFYRNQNKWVLVRDSNKKIEDKTPTSRNLNETYRVEGEEAAGFNDAFLETGPSAPTDMSEFETEEYPPESWSSAEEELLKLVPDLNDVRSHNDIRSHNDVNLNNREPEHSIKLSIYRKKTTPDLIRNYQINNNNNKSKNLNVVNQDDYSEKVDPSTLEKFTKNRRIDINNNKIIVHNDQSNETNSQLRSSFGDVRSNECLVDFNSYHQFLILAQMDAAHETLYIPVVTPECYIEEYQYPATEAKRRRNEGWPRETLPRVNNSRRPVVEHGNLYVHVDNSENYTGEYQYPATETKRRRNDGLLRETLPFENNSHRPVVEHGNLFVQVDNSENYTGEYQYPATETKRRRNDGLLRETLPFENNSHRPVVEHGNLFVQVDNSENYTGEYQYPATETKRRRNEGLLRETLPWENNSHRPVVDHEILYGHVDNSENYTGEHQYSATESEGRHNDDWCGEVQPRMNNSHWPVESEEILRPQSVGFFSPDRRPQQAQTVILLQRVPLPSDLEPVQPEEGAQMGRNVDYLDTQPQRFGSTEQDQEQNNSSTNIRSRYDPSDYERYLEELLRPPPMFFENIADPSLVEAVPCHQLMEQQTEQPGDPENFLSEHLQNLRLAEMYILEAFNGESEDSNQDNAPTLDEEPWPCDSVDSGTFMAGAHRAPHSSEIDLLALVQNPSPGDIPFWRLFPPPNFEENPNRDFGTGLGQQTGLNATAAPFQPNIAPYQPNTAPFQPNTAPFQPNAAPFQPNTAPFQPNTAPVHSNTAPFQPSTAPFQPNTAPFQPNTAPFQPNTAPFQPNTAPFQSNTAPFQPNNVTLRPKSSRFCLNSRPPPGFSHDDVNSAGPRGDAMPFDGRGRGRLHRQ